MKELIIKKGDKQITLADKEDVMDALDDKSDNTHGHGNLQNDGRVGTSNNASKNVVTDGSGKITTEAKPSIPVASSTVPLADTVSGSVGKGTTWAKADHTHKKSGIYAEANHTHNLNLNNLNIYADGQGGTNLIEGTQSFITSLSNVGLTDGTYQNCTYRRVNNTSGTNYLDIGFKIPAGTFKHGERYTLSFWAKGTGNIIVFNTGGTNYVKTKPINCTSGGTNPQNFSQYNDGNVQFALTSEWKRYFVTWELNPTSNSTNDISVNKIILLRTIAGADAYWAGVMYERGEIPHDWSPSPLDNSEFDYSRIKGTDNTVGYIKALQLQIGAVYQDKPIKIETYQRNRKTTNTINIAFQNANHTDPGVSTGSFSYYGDENFKAYLYKESAGVWSLITSKGHADKYGEMMVKISNPNTGISITKLDTHIANLPSSTTNNPLYTASCLEKITTATVTYTDGNTSTINFVTR